MNDQQVEALMAALLRAAGFAQEAAVKNAREIWSLVRQYPTNTTADFEVMDGPEIKKPLFTVDSVDAEVVPLAEAAPEPQEPAAEQTQGSGLFPEPSMYLQCLWQAWIQAH